MWFETLNATLYLLVYVDDIVITDNNEREIQSFITTLNAKLYLKFMDMFSYFLCIEVNKLDNGDFPLTRKSI